MLVNTCNRLQTILFDYKPNKTLMSLHLWVVINFFQTVQYRTSKFIIMYSLNNSVTLIGNVGQDIELKTLESGAKYVKASVATNSYYKDKNGEKVTKVTWHPVIAWNRQAEIMEKILRKGSRIMLQGELNHDSYKTKDGETRYYSEVRIHNFTSLTPKAETALPF